MNMMNNLLEYINKLHKLSKQLNLIHQYNKKKISYSY